MQLAEELYNLDPKCFSRHGLMSGLTTYSLKNGDGYSNRAYESTAISTKLFRV